MKEYVLACKALSDKTRLRIMKLLLVAGRDLCVCEIVDSLAEPQHKISRHLKELKYAGLVAEEKEGRWVYYSAAKPRDEFMRNLLKAVDSIPAHLTASEDRRLRVRLSLREDGKCVVGLESEQWRMRTDRNIDGRPS